MAEFNLYQFANISNILSECFHQLDNRIAIVAKVQRAVVFLTKCRSGFAHSDHAITANKALNTTTSVKCHLTIDPVSKIQGKGQGITNLGLFLSLAGTISPGCRRGRLGRLFSGRYRYKYGFEDHIARQRGLNKTPLFSFSFAPLRFLLDVYMLAHSNHPYFRIGRNVTALESQAMRCYCACGLSKTVYFVSDLIKSLHTCG